MAGKAVEQVLNPLILKYEQFVQLSADEVAALDALSACNVRKAGAREDIISEGERPRHVNLLLSGWACRYKVLEDGRRQNIALFLPGDFCDLHVFILAEMDHSIGALTPVTYAEVPREAFERLQTGHPRVHQAFWWDTLVTAAIQREWSVNLGQRSALERIAHLLCELHHRLRAVGMARGAQFDMHLTQTDLAEATGMTSVHVNRTLQELRARDLIRWRGRDFEILDLVALVDLAMFNPNYLHADHDGQRLDANDRG